MIIKTLSYLPLIFQTPANQKFLNATLDQLVAQPDFKKINGYIGRKFAPTYRAGDNYVPEPTAERQNYQLEPSVVSLDINGETQFFSTYTDLLQQIEYYGGITNNHTRLFDQESYTFDGKIDFDKFVNFSEYYWLPTGPDPVTVYSVSSKLRQTFEITRNLAVNAYTISGFNNSPNPEIILARGGVYQFVVDQPGFNFWIQTDIGTSGTKLTQPNISTRQILGVDNNGTDNGTVTFTVPQVDAQDGFITMPLVQSIDFATNLLYSDIQGKNLATFAGIDGVSSNLPGKYLIFTSNDTNASNWGNTDPSHWNGIWQIQLSGANINLVWIKDIPVGEKVFIKSGSTYVNLEFYKITTGQLEQVPPASASLNILYYADSTSPGFYGTIRVVDPLTFQINVETEILGKQSYTSPNGVVFTNGLKITFNNTVTPASYAGNTYYVEGVGSSIKLLPVDLYGGTSTLDYIVINRSSIDGNSWSKTNSWFHSDVIAATSTYNNTVPLLDQLTRASRPIIEFSPNLQLFNYGRVEKPYVNILDFTSTDAFTQVQGSVLFDPAVYKTGETIIFAADQDPNVKNKIYNIDIATIAGGAYTVSESSPTAIGSLVAGETYVIDILGTTNWAAVGAAVPTPGIPFVATGPGTGTGIAYHIIYTRPGHFVSGQTYQITDVGTMNWSLLGVSSPTVGLQFIAIGNGATTGTGAAQFVTQPESFINLTEVLNGDVLAYDVVIPNTGMLVKLNPSNNSQFDTNTSFRTIDYSLLPADIGTLSLTTVNGYGTAGTLIEGYQYEIKYAGTTDFTLYGSPDNLVGTIFTATNTNLPTTGQQTGIAQLLNIVDSGFVSGKSYWFNGINWVQSQQKTSTNQSPLFDIVDNNLISLGDPTIYYATSFKGCPIFTYLQGTGTADPALGFPISYRNINNVGDIEFTNNYDTDTFNQLVGLTTVTNNVNSGFIPVIVDRTTIIKENMWVKKFENSKQYQIFSAVYDGSTSNFQIDILPDQSQFIPNLKVYVNSIELVSTSYSITTVGIVNYLTISSTLSVGDEIDILIYSATQVSTAGYYEIPSNLDYNALNENFTVLTHGQFRNHVATIASNTTEILGKVPGQSNLRDLSVKTFGGSILQHSSPLIYSELFLLNKDLNFMDASTYVQLEYNRFKNKFLEAFPSVVDAGILDPAVAVDTILLQLNTVKNDKSPWYYSDMVPYGGNKVTTTYTVLNVDITAYEIASIFNDNILGNKAILVYLNGSQLVKGIDFTFDQTRPAINFIKLLNYGDTITINTYSNTDGNFIPETPTKLGLYPKFTPEKFVDSSYQSSPIVIRGHDGSITPAFGDMRDELLLELEKRIYNNIKVEYTTSKFDLFKFIPGKFRETEYTKAEFDQILSRSFMEWISNNRTDYSDNQWFQSGNQWSWTYSSFKDKIDGSYLPGYWKGIYKYFYDTDAPHLRAWEMLGFSEMPDWWIDTYGPAPYTAGNKVLWDDLESGTIIQGTRAGTYPQYARPGLSTVIPVDVYGNLLSPNEFLVTGFNGSTVDDTFVFGDNGPVENAWRTSSHYPFAVQRAIALMKPALYFAQLANVQDYSNTNELGQWLFVDNSRRITLKTLEVNGEVITPLTATAINPTGSILRQAGYLNWISDYVAGYGASSPTMIHSYLDTLSVKLGYRAAGFTDQSFISIFADQASPNSTNKSIVIPNENYQVYVHKSAPISSIVYSAVIIEKTTRGFSVSGYSTEQPYFTIIPSNPNNNFYTISTAGITGVIYNDYQPLTITVPYGHEFVNKQQVVDFLTSYSRYLISLGFTFTEVDPDLQIAKDWILSAKEFLTWTQQGWAVGNIIVVSPISNSISLTVNNGVVDEITNFPNGSKVMDVGFNVIKSNLFTVIRDTSEFNLTTAAPNITIGLLDVDVVQYENALIFDNTTVFNDVIYAPELGNRQYRLKLIGDVTSSWTGEFNPPGLIYSNPSVQAWQQGKDYRQGDIVGYNNFLYSALQDIDATNTFNYSYWAQLDQAAFKTGMLPNLSYNASKFLDMYDVDNQVADQNINEYAMGLIGYRDRDYLTQLRVDTTSQVKFYQGFIRDKGTKNAVNALASATFENLNGTLNFYEEWAFRVGNYGSTLSNQFLEVQLYDNLYKYDPMSFALLNNNETTTDTGVVGVYESDLYKKSLTFTPAIIENRSPESIYSSDIASAGYVNLNDVDATVFDITDAASLNALVPSISTGFKLWVAKDNTSNWNVYRLAEALAKVIDVLYQLNNFALFTTSTTHGLVAGDIFVVKGFSSLVDGFYTVIRSVDDQTNNIYTLFVAITDSLNAALIVTPEITGDGNMFNLSSMRVKYQTNILDITPGLGWINNDKVWIDTNDANSNWAVYQKTDPWNFVDALALDSTQITANALVGSSIASTSDGLLVAIGAPSSNLLPNDGSIKIFTRTLAGNYIPGNSINPSLSPNRPFISNITLYNIPYLGSPIPGTAPFKLSLSNLGFTPNPLNIVTVVWDDIWVPGLVPDSLSNPAGIGVPLISGIQNDYVITYNDPDPLFLGQTTITFRNNPTLHGAVSSLRFRLAEVEPEKFGESLDIKQNTIAVGSPGYRGAGPNEGRVAIYNIDSTGTISMTQSIDPELLNATYNTLATYQYIATDDLFGSSVSLSDDAQWLFVGSPHSQWNGIIGSVYAFALKDITSSTQTITTSGNITTYPLTISNISNQLGITVLNQFYSLIPNVDYVIDINASTITFTKNPAGKIYQVNQGPYYDFNSVIAPNNGDSGDQFGSVVKSQADGRYIVVGAKNKTINAQASVGQSYLFTRSVQDIIGDGITSSFNLYQVPNTQSNAYASTYSLSGQEYTQVLDTNTSVSTYNLTFTANTDAIITVTPNVPPALSYTIDYDTNQIIFNTNPGNIQCNITQTITSTYNFVPNVTPNVYLSGSTISFGAAPGKNLVLHVELNNFSQIQTFNSNNALLLDSGANFGNAVTLSSTLDEVFVGATGSMTQDGRVFRFTNPSITYNTILLDLVPTASNIIINNKFIDLTSANANVYAILSTITSANIVGLSSSIEGNAIRLTYNSTKANDNLTVLETNTAGEIIALGSSMVNTQTLVHPVISQYIFSNSQFGSTLAYDNVSGTLVAAASNSPTIENFQLDGFSTTFDGNSTRIFDKLDNTGAVYAFEELYNPLNSIDVPSKFIFTQSFAPASLVENINFGSAIAMNYNSIFIGANNADVTPVDAHGVTGNIAPRAGNVFYYSNPTVTSAWGQIRQEAPKVDLASVSRIFLYDRTSQAILSSLDYIDPAKGKILGAAEQDITFKSAFDPAKYNVGTNANTSVRQNYHWGKTQVGQIWWDLSKVQYIDYEQDTLSYRIKNWGSLFPGSTIEINEWVESSVLPSQYSGDGTVKYPDNSAYVQSTMLNSSTGFIVTTYYYWVTNRTTLDSSLTFRRSTALTIANMIKSPATQGIPYAAIIQDNALAMYSANQYLNADRTIMHIDYEKLANENIIHNEYELIQENSPNAIIPSDIVSKLIDSLTGADAFGNPVPDVQLGVAERYGITIRPRQTMFIDNLTATKNMVEFANTVFLTLPVVEEFDLTNLYLSDPVPVTWGNLYPVAWKINTQYVADELVSYNGKTYLVKFDLNSGTYFNAPYYAETILPDVSVSTPIELTYLDTSLLSIHQVILVEQDSNYNNGWSLYQLGINRTFTVIRTETYQTSNYWSKVDWFDSTYDPTIKPTHTVGTIPDIGNLTLVSGDTVWVLNNGAGLFIVYKVNTDLSLSLVGLQQGTIQLSDALWNHAAYEIGFDNDRFDTVKFDLNPTTEFRNILYALYNNIFTNSLAGEFNNMFFILLNYILSEQRTIDWAIKTSFVSVLHQLRKLLQYPNYIEDNQTYYQSYIDEVKPYRTTIREYVIDYQGDDLVRVHPTDFDLPPYFDTEFNMWRSPNGEHAKDTLILSTYPQYADWNANHTYSIGNVAIISGGIGYTDPPEIIVEGGGGTGAILQSSIDLNGIVKFIKVVKPGYGYTTTPTLLVRGNGVDSTGAQTCRLYPLLSNTLVRGMNTSIKFDRVSYSSTVKHWAKNITLNGGDIVSYNGAVYTVNGNSSITTGVVFELSNYTPTSIDTLNAADRVNAFYAPTEGMPPNILSNLFTGIDYSGVIVDGTDFVHYVDANGIEYTVDAHGNKLPLDSNIQSYFGDSLLGTRPQDINIDGGHFIDTWNSHAPEELVPGRVFDTLDIKVFTANLAAGPTYSDSVGYRMSKAMTVESNTTIDALLAVPTTFDTNTMSLDFINLELAWEFKRISAASTTTLAKDLFLVETVDKLLVGDSYTITSVGNTDFVALGAATNTVGEVFTANTGIVNVGNLVSGMSYKISSLGNTDFTLSGATSVSAGHFNSNTYIIESSGDTDFISLGAADNLPGTVFTYTGEFSTPKELLNGNTYIISQTGTTDFVALGASASIVGLPFIANTSAIVSSGNLTIGKTYSIISAGNTDFVALGAARDTTGELFTYGDQKVNAGSFVINKNYAITSVGNTDFTLIGAANNTVGTNFIYSGQLINAGSIGVNTAYRITVPGNTDFVALGSSNNNIGETFVYQEVPVTAGSFVIGKTYTIINPGNTDFTLIGSLSNLVGTSFVATGTGNVGETGVTLGPRMLRAGSFVIGKSYIIVSLGNTDFTAVGASSNTVGTPFIAINAGVGTGSVDPNTGTGIVDPSAGTGIADPNSGTGIVDPLNGSGIASGPMIAVTSSLFTVGKTYKISYPGTTDFVALGAASNTVGEVFTASSTGTGTGVVDPNIGTGTAYIREFVATSSGSGTGLVAVAGKGTISPMQIHVTNGSNLYYPNPLRQSPGIVYINSEKIIYWGLDATAGIITNFRRGTWGTGSEDFYPAGTAVVDASVSQLIPGNTLTTSWLDLAISPNPPAVILEGNGLLASSTPQALFLQSSPVNLPSLP